MHTINDSIPPTKSTYSAGLQMWASLSFIHLHPKLMWRFWDTCLYFLLKPIKLIKFYANSSRTMPCFGKQPHSVWKDDLTCCLVWPQAEKNFVQAHIQSYSPGNMEFNSFPTNTSAKEGKHFQLCLRLQEYTFVNASNLTGRDLEFRVQCHHSNHKPKVRQPHPWWCNAGSVEPPPRWGLT